LEVYDHISFDDPRLDKFPSLWRKNFLSIIALVPHLASTFLAIGEPSKQSREFLTWVFTKLSKSREALLKDQDLLRTVDSFDKGMGAFLGTHIPQPRATIDVAVLTERLISFVPAPAHMVPYEFLASECSVLMTDEYMTGNNDAHLRLGNACLDFHERVRVAFISEFGQPPEVNVLGSVNILQSIVFCLAARRIPIDDIAFTKTRYYLSVLHSSRAQCCICGAVAKSKCSKCQVVRYCSPQCQKADWKLHKTYCGPCTVEDIVREIWTSPPWKDIKSRFGAKPHS
jgi:hypothetical protein